MSLVSGAFSISFCTVGLLFVGSGGYPKRLATNCRNFWCRLARTKHSRPGFFMAATQDKIDFKDIGVAFCGHPSCDQAGPATYVVKEILITDVGILPC